MLASVQWTTRDDLVAAVAQVHDHTAAFWRAFSADDFLRPLGAGWSPAETVRHLVKSTRPVALALTLPWFVLRFRFGKPERPSVTYEALVATYRAKLDAGGGAGRFAPTPRVEHNHAAARERILGDFDHVNRKLGIAIARWPDAALDRYQLPHPILGNLTLREMLFFTLYHQQHHMQVVQRKLQRPQL